VCAVGVDGQAWCGAERLWPTGTACRAGICSETAAEGYAFKKISVSTAGVRCDHARAGKRTAGHQEGGRLGDGTVAPGGQSSPHRWPFRAATRSLILRRDGDHACGMSRAVPRTAGAHNERGQLATGALRIHPCPSQCQVAWFTSITTHQCWMTAGSLRTVLGTAGAKVRQVISAVVRDLPAMSSADQGGLLFSSLPLGLWTTCGVTTDGDGFVGHDGSGRIGIGSKESRGVPEPMKVVDDINGSPSVPESGYLWPHQRRPGILLGR